MNSKINIPVDIVKGCEENKTTQWRENWQQG